MSINIYDSSVKCYSELITLPTFEERFRYLKLDGRIGEETFGFDRHLNQMIYQKSPRWKKARDLVIIRDNGCDLGVDGHEIDRYIVVHHMNPITLEDIEEERDVVFDPEYLICCTSRTHQAIHFGDEGLLPKDYVERRPNDTCLWR